MLDTVSVSVMFVCEIEAVSVADLFQRSRLIDEKYGVVDVVFPVNFTEEDLRESVRSRRFKLRVDYSFESGSTAAYSQYCSSSIRITVSSTAT